MSTRGRLIFEGFILNDKGVWPLPLDRRVKNKAPKSGRAGLSIINSHIFD